MILTDTPNPAAKKIVLNHKNKIGEYLDINNFDENSIEYKILRVDGVNSVFAGPGFLTIIKNDISEWDFISAEINAIFDKL